MDLTGLFILPSRLTSRQVLISHCIQKPATAIWKEMYFTAVKLTTAHCYYG